MLWILADEKFGINGIACVQVGSVILCMLELYLRSFGLIIEVCKILCFWLAKLRLIHPFLQGPFELIRQASS